MNTPRGLLVPLALVWSLVLPCLVASAAHAYRPQNKKIKVEVTVRDAEGHLVGNARVNIWRNRIGFLSGTPDYSADTTPDGVARFEIETVASYFSSKPKLDLIIHVLKPDFEMHDDKIVVVDPPDEVTRTITIRRFAIQIGPMTFKVHVETAAGTPVAGAQVDVWANTWPTRLRASGQTDAAGNAEIEVRRFDDFEIVVNKQGVPEARKTVKIPGNPLPQVTGPYTVKLAAGTIVNLTVKDKDNQRGVGNARVVLNGKNVIAFRSETTDDAGHATLLVPETGSFSVTISQENYETLKGEEVRILHGEGTQDFTFALKAKPKKLDDGPNSIDVTVLAADKYDRAALTSSNLPLADARVIIGSTTVGTDARGHVRVGGEFEGDVEVTVEAEGYTRQAKKVHVVETIRAAGSHASVTFLLQPEGTADSVEVIVLAREKNCEYHCPPLEGATVTAGGQSVTTDSDGRALLQGRYDEESIKVEKPGYKRQVGQVSSSGANRFSQGAKRGTLTVILQPVGTAEDTVDVLVVAATTGGASLPISGATVTISGVKSTTDASGHANLTGLFGRAENVTAEARGYVGRTLSVPLNKETGLRRVVITLARDWTELRAAVGALEPRVFAWNNDIGQSGQDAGLVQRLAEQAPPAVQRAAALLQEVNDAAALNSGTMGISAAAMQCRKAMEPLENLKKQAQAKEAQLKTKLDNAAQLAANCSSVKDADAVRVAYRESIRLAGEIGVLEKQARANTLALQAWLTDARNERGQKLATVEQKVAELRQEAAKAEQAAGTVGAAFVRADNLQKTLYASHTTLTGELVRLKATYSFDSLVNELPADLLRRVDAMTNLLGRQNNNMFGGPSVEWVKTVQDAAARIRANKDSAEVLLARYKSATEGDCNPALESLVQETADANVSATIELGAAASLLDKAQTCATTQTQTAGGSDSPIHKQKVEDLPEDETGNRGGTNNATTKTTNKTNKSGVKVEDIPEDNSNTIASHRPSSRTGGRTPVVEEIPDTPTGGGNGANRGADNPPPTNRSDKNKLPPGLARNPDGTLHPKDGYEWVNPDDPKDLRVRKKEKDPNRPDVWSRLGGAIRAGINGDTTGGTNDSGTDTNSGGGGGIPAVMYETEGGFSGTWTRRGNQFEAVWSNGARATLTIEKFDSEQVVITRNDTGASVSQNFSARYTGRRSGNSVVDGKVQFQQGGRTWSGEWSASW